MGVQVHLLALAVRTLEARITLLMNRFMDVEAQLARLSERGIAGRSMARMQQTMSPGRHNIQQ